MKYFFILLVVAFSLAGCDMVPSSDQVQRLAQEKISSQGNAVVGMPAILNFQEKRMMKDIIEMRDKAIVTYTYIVDMNGKLHKVCDSIGYGLPYATQYTNPSRVVWESNHSNVLPQADPNGLFSPASADGTWIMCKDPNGAKVSPVYIEPRIIVSQFPLG